MQSLFPRVTAEARAARPEVTLPAPVAPMDDATCARAARRLALAIGLGAMAYAILRYVVVGQVAPAQVPLYILNKATAFTGAALLAICLVLTPLMRRVPRLLAWGGLRKHLGLTGFAFSAAHVLMTFALMSPAYYPKLHLADGHMSLQGELALLTGLLAFFALVLPAATSLPIIRQSLAPARWTAFQKLAVVGLALTGAHLLALGLPTWLTPEQWPAALPPITLIGMVVVAVTLLARRV